MYIHVSEKNCEEVVVYDLGVIAERDLHRADRGRSAGFELSKQNLTMGYSSV